MTTTVAVSDRVRSAFDFSVDKFPLCGPESMRTPFYGLFRSDNQSIVGSPVSRLYIAHQTDDVLALVDAVSEAFDGVANVECYFRDGHYVSITPSDQQRLNVFGTVDNVHPRVLIRAGYDGKAFKASVGYYRDLCRNLSMIRKVSGTTVSIRHSSGLREKMGDLIKTFETVKNGWKSLSEVILHMENSRVSMVDFLDRVYGTPQETTGRAVTMHKNRTEAIFRRLQRERFESGRPSMGSDFMVSAWEAYNAVQGYVQHDSNRRGGVSSFGRAIAATSDRAVQLAEQLALSI